MKKVYAFVLLCLALNASGAPVTNVQNLAKFGLVSSMSMTDLFAIEINSHPRGITAANVSNLFLSSFSTFSDIWTNKSGVIITKTNLPIALGTNALGTPSRLYIQDQITNDSMSSVFVRMVPRIGVGDNRSGFCVQMDRGDDIGGYSLALYGLNQASSSNSGALNFGNIPYGVIGLVNGPGSGESVGVIGNAQGTNTLPVGISGMAYGNSTIATNIGVIGRGHTSGSVAIGGYFELGAGATIPRFESSVLLLDNRQTAKPILVARTNGTYTTFALLANGHAQLNSNEVYALVQGTNILFITNGTQLTIHGTSTSGGGLTGTTNSIMLSVQAGKPPVPLTNFPGIDPGWQMWEGLYYKTNAEGSIADLSQTWDFTVPDDYATNSLVVHNWSFLESTNGPNSSNSIWRVSIAKASPGDSTDIHTITFGTTVTGTNTWAASGTGTNKIQDLRIALSTASLLKAGDIATLKLERVGTLDTFGGVVGLSRLRLEYTRQ